MSSHANLFTAMATRADQGSLTAVCSVSPGLALRPGVYGIQIKHMAVSSMIPNVYVDAVNFTNTTRFRISPDAGVTWIDCILTPGFYTVTRLSQAIITATVDNGICPPAGIADPPILLGSNPTNGDLVLRIDSTKALPGILPGIDFQLDLRTLTGFVGTSTFVADGVFDASDHPLIDFQSSVMSIRSSTFRGSSYISAGGAPAVCSDELVRFTIPAVISAEIVVPSWRTILEAPIVYCTLGSQFNGFTASFVDARTGRPITFLYGDASISIAVTKV